MAAYMIIFAKVTDREKFMSGYAPTAAKLVEQFGGKYVLRAPGAKILEGDVEDGSSVVISEWPDEAAAMAFWNSPEYSEAKKLREGAAIVRVALVEAPSLTS